MREFLERDWLPVPDEQIQRQRNISVERHDGFALLSLGRTGPFSNWVIPERTGFTAEQARAAVGTAAAFFRFQAKAYFLLGAGLNEFWLNGPPGAPRRIHCGGMRFHWAATVDLARRWGAPLLIARAQSLRKRANKE